MERTTVSFITKNVEQFTYFDSQLRKPMWRGKNVLDFGGNVGNILHHPNSTIDHDKYWCFDVSSDAIAVGKKAAPEANFVFYNRYNFEYNPNGIRGLPIPQTGNKFDFILALSVFTHTAKTEMIEIVNHLQGLLNAGGRLAFSFFDPHYIPQDSDVCNLRYYLQQRASGLSDQELDALTNRARGASRCTVTNGAVEIEDKGLRSVQGIEEEGYLVFYTPEYLQTIFPHGKMVEPVGSFPRQHCCIINDGYGQ
jgi:SAM-dependent methyltransferase